MGAAGNVNIVLSIDSKTYSKGMADAQKQLDQLAGKTGEAAAVTRKSMAQARESVALLADEFGLHLPRAIKGFVAELPGVGSALASAFSVGAVAAIGIALVDAGKRLYDFIHAAEQAPQKLQLALGALGNSQRTAGDQLDLSNDKLREQIAILEGKHVNNAALAFDEAKLASDRLAESLEKSAAQMQAVRAANGISRTSAFFSGVFGSPEKSTADTAEELKRRQNQDTQLGYQISIAQAGGDTAGVARLTAQLKRSQDEELAFDRARMALDKAQSAAPHSALDFNINPNATKGIDTASDQGVLLGDQARILSDQAQQKKEAHNAQLQAQADIAAKQKELQAQEVQGWHQQLDDLKAEQDTTILQEAQFWIKRAESVKQGSLAYRAAMDEANKTIASMRQQDLKARQEFDALSGGQTQPTDTQAQAETRMKAEAYLRSPDRVEETPALKEQGAETVEYLKNLNEGIALEKKNADALAEESIAMSVATGQMSQLDAARARAALHTQEYADALEELDRAQANVASDSALTSTERQAQLSALGNQRSQVSGQRDVQVLQDQQAIVSQTVTGATTEALGQMVDAWKDMAGQIAKTLTQTIGGFNDDIVKLLTQKQIYPGDVRRAFGGTVEEGAQGLLRTGLQKGESAIFGAFGVGKPDGSSVDRALWVRFATATDAMKSDAQAGIARIFGAKPGSGGAPSIGSDISSFISKVLGGRGGASSSGTAAAAEPSSDSDVARVLRGVPTLLKRPSAAAAGSSGDDSGDDGSWQGFPYALPPATQSSSQPNFMTSLVPGGDGTGIPNQNPGEPTDITTILHPAPSQAGNLTSKITSMLLSSFLHGNNQGGAGVGGDDSDGGDDSGGDITSLIGGGPSNSSNSDGMFQGFFARGGDVLANRPAIVGEKGPEVFMPTSAGKIIPNHQLGGGGTTHNISIDARGANDPAQVEAAVHRGMRSYLPQAVAAAAARVRDQQKRGPGTAR